MSYFCIICPFGLPLFGGVIFVQVTCFFFVFCFLFIFGYVGSSFLCEGFL